MQSDVDDGPIEEEPEGLRLVGQEPHTGWPGEATLRAWSAPLTVLGVALVALVLTCRVLLPLVVRVVRRRSRGQVLGEVQEALLHHEHG